MRAPEQFPLVLLNAWLNHFCSIGSELAIHSFLVVKGTYYSPHFLLEYTHIHTYTSRTHTLRQEPDLEYISVHSSRTKLPLP